jgi:hypothetical protein
VVNGALQFGVNVWLYVCSAGTTWVTMGSMPPAGFLPYLPSFATAASAASVNLPTLPATLGTSAASVPLPTQPVTSEGTSGAALVPAGGYMGEGLLPVPDKLVKKILKLEFVEMQELLPESWLREEEETKSLVGFHRRKRSTTTNIFQWLQCYSAMVGVLSRAYPQVVPDLMAYQATIIRCYRDFEDLHWAQYDRMYRRQVAITKDLRWGRIDTTLYSKCFAGKARRRSMCTYCLSDSHTSQDCHENPANVSWPWVVQNNAQHTAYNTPSEPAFHGRMQSEQPHFGAGRRGTCDLFNAAGGSKCAFNPCKYLHLCSDCRGKHPRAACQGGRGGSSRGGRSTQPKRPRLE